MINATGILLHTGWGGNATLAEERSRAMVETAKGCCNLGSTWMTGPWASPGEIDRLLQAW